MGGHGKSLASLKSRVDCRRRELLDGASEIGKAAPEPDMAALPVPVAGPNGWIGPARVEMDELQSSVFARSPIDRKGTTESFHMDDALAESGTTTDGSSATKVP
jgi:hypothetical protein